MNRKCGSLYILSLLHDAYRREDPTSKLGEDLRRIFFERGHDFFDKNSLGANAQKESEEEKEPDTRDNVQPMTPDELLKMRIEIMPQLQ